MSATWFREFVRSVQDSGMVKSQAEIGRIFGKSSVTISRWCVSGVPRGEEKLVRLACASVARGDAGWE